MGSANDKKILALRAKIEEKKNKIEKTKFVPITNCSIELDGIRHNIQVLSKDQLTFLLIKLNSYFLSMIDLESNYKTVSCNISGYSIKEWLTDIKLKLDVLSQKNEEANLKALENKLNTLLSEDKKTEIELESIAKTLGV
jgi:hypothetical protein